MTEITATPPMSISFDYGSLESDEVGEQLREAASRIRKTMRQSFVDVGRDLIKAKTLLEHGQFTKWLQVEFSMSDRSAQNYMNAARLIDEKTATFSVLPPSALYMLASPSMPPEVLADVEKEVQAGARPTTAEIREKVQSYRCEAECRKRTAEEAAKEAKLSPRQRKRRADARKEQEERARQWKQHEAESAAAAAEISKVLRKHVPANALRAITTLPAKLRFSDRDIAKISEAAAQLVVE